MEQIKIHLPNIVGKGYKKFWDSKQRYVVVKGGRGSKKSCTTALRFIYNMMKYYKLYGVKPNLLVIRRYFNTHKDSTRAQLVWAINRLNVGHLWSIPKAGHTLTFRPSGQQILFRGLDDPMSITSITVSDGVLCWVWWEEAYQIINESDFDKVDMSIRGTIPDVLFKQHVLTFNPWNKKHWLKKRFFDTEDPDILAMTTTFRCNEWLDEADLNIYQKMSPARFLVEGDGEWGISEGAIYTEFIENEKDFYIDWDSKAKAFFIDGDFRKLAYINIGVDWGGSKSGHAITATGITRDFEYVVTLASARYDAKGTTPEMAWGMVEEFIDAVEVIYGQIDDVYADSEEQMMKSLLEEKLAKTNIGVRNSVKPLIIDRIDFTNAIMEQRRFYMTRNCENVAEFFRSAIYDPKVLARKRLDDGSYDVDSGDSWEYSVTRYMKFIIKG